MFVCWGLTSEQQQRKIVDYVTVTLQNMVYEMMDKIFNQIIKLSKKTNIFCITCSQLKKRCFSKPKMAIFGRTGNPSMYKVYMIKITCDGYVMVM